MALGGKSGFLLLFFIAGPDLSNYHYHGAGYHGLGELLVSQVILRYMTAFCPLHAL